MNTRFSSYVVEEGWLAFPCGLERSNFFDSLRQIYIKNMNIYLKNRGIFHIDEK